MRFTPIFCCSSKTANITSDEQTTHVADANNSDCSLGSSTQDTKHIKTELGAQPYTAAQAVVLFSNYADDDDASIIGPVGFEKLCYDAGIPLDSALPLLLAWQFGASEVATFSRAEWEKGTAELQ